MAGRARDRHMRARQRKTSRVVIERRVQPGRGAVAQRAVLREVGGHVIWHTGNRRRVVVILRMAAVAVGG